MTVTPCAWSDPRLLPQHGSVPSLCSLGRLLCPPPKGLGQYMLGQDSSLKRRAGCSYPCWKRWEHPRSLAFAAVMGTPPPSTYHHPFLTPTMFFVCVNCAIFILFLSLLFTRRNKGVEILGPLVLVIRMKERPLPCVLFSAFSEETFLQLSLLLPQE